MFFQFLQKPLCRHSSLAPRSRIKAFVRKRRRCSPPAFAPPPPPPPPPPVISFNSFWTSTRELVNPLLYFYFPNFECRIFGKIWGLRCRRLLRCDIVTSLILYIGKFFLLSFHMFPFNEILKVFKSIIWLDIRNKHPKINLNTKFQPNQSRGLGVTSIWNLGLQVG